MAARRRRGRSEELGKTVRQFWQLCASLLLLAAVLTARFFAPAETRAFLHGYFVGEKNYTELLETIGENLRAFFADGEVVAADGDAPDASAVPESTVSPAPTESAPPDNADDGGNGEAEEETPSGRDTESGGNAESLGDTGDTDTIADSMGIGGFDEPLTVFSEGILMIDERYLVAPAVEGEDDTLPLPFGFEKPEKADYTVYELPFALVTPAEGRFSSPFGYRIHPIYSTWSFHYGVDIANATGSAVYAAADGVVLSCGVSQSYGKYILINHAEGYATFYAHLNYIRVREGQGVTAGTRIADMGATGQVTGPHLHFELRKDGSFLDPGRYLTLA